MQTHTHTRVGLRQPGHRKPSPIHTLTFTPRQMCMRTQMHTLLSTSLGSTLTFTLNLT